MRKSLLAFLVILFWTLCPQPATAQEASPTPETRSSSDVETPTPATGTGGLPAASTLVSPGISAPQPNADLNGIVSISGLAPGPWDLSFAYAGDATGTWFPLAASNDPVSGEFILWDTTSVTDGFYLLRLRITAADALQEYTVDFRIRNYSPVETATPIPTPSIAPTFTAPPPTALPAFTPTVTYTPAPLPTPFSPNPVALNPADIAVNFGKGALGVTAIFVLFGLLLTISKKLRS